MSCSEGQEGPVPWAREQRSQASEGRLWRPPASGMKQEGGFRQAHGHPGEQGEAAPEGQQSRHPVCVPFFSPT